MNAKTVKSWIQVILVVVVLCGLATGVGFFPRMASGQSGQPEMMDGIEGVKWAQHVAVFPKLNPDSHKIAVEAQGPISITIEKIQLNVEDHTAVAQAYQLGGDIDVFGKGLSFGTLPLASEMNLEDEMYPVKSVVFTHPTGDGNIVRLGIAVNIKTGFCEIYNRSDPFVVLTENGHFTQTLHLSSEEAFTPITFNENGVVKVNMQVFLDKAMKIDGGVYQYTIDTTKCKGLPPTATSTATSTSRPPTSTPTWTPSPSPSPTPTSVGTPEAHKLWLPMVAKSCPVGTHWDPILERCEYNPTPTMTATPSAPTCPVFHWKSGPRPVDGGIAPGIPEVPLTVWVDNSHGFSYGTWKVVELPAPWGSEIRTIAWETNYCSEQTCSTKPISGTQQAPKPRPGTTLVVTFQGYPEYLAPSNCGTLLYVDPPGETPSASMAKPTITLEEAQATIADAESKGLVIDATK